MDSENARAVAPAPQADRAATTRRRFWRALGVTGPGGPVAGGIYDAPLEIPMVTLVNLDWRDRLRALLTGQVRLAQKVRLRLLVADVDVASDFAVVSRDAEG